MSRKPTLADHALQLIETHGPATTSELGLRMASLGVTHARDPETAARSAVGGNRFLEGEDGRVYSLVAQLEGAYLVHRLSDFEKEHELMVIGEGDWLIERLLRAGIRTRSDGADRMALSWLESVFDLPQPELDDDELWPDPHWLPRDKCVRGNRPTTSSWPTVGPPSWSPRVGVA